MKPRYLSSSLAFSIPFILACGSSLATTLHWTGGSTGVNVNMMTASNWQEGDSPTGSNAPYDLVIAGRNDTDPPASPLPTIPTLVTGADYTIRSFSADNAAGRFGANGLRIGPTTLTGSTTQRILTLDTANVTSFSATNNATTTFWRYTSTAALTFNLAYTGKTTVHTDATSSLTFDTTAITGTGGLIKTGPGTLTFLSIANTFEGGLTIQDGVVSVAGANRLGSVATPKEDAVVIDGGTLRFTGTTDSSSSRGFQVGSSVGTIDIAGADVSVNIGALIQDVPSEAGKLVKTGPGTLSLAAQNTFTGGIAINAGVVAVSSSLYLGPTTPNPDAVVINGGTLRFTGTSDLTSVSGRGFRVGSSIGTIEIADVEKEVTVAAVIQDVDGEAGSLVKTGAGILELDNSNTFTGGVTISQGILALATPDRLGSAAAANPSAVIINGGTLRFTGTSTISPSANRGMRVGAATGTIEVTDVAKIVNVLGAVRDVTDETGNLVKTGLGTLSLNSASNSYTGTTTVSEGTLLLGPAGVLPSPVTVADDASFGGSGQATGAVTVSGNLLPGPSTLNTPGTLQVGGELVLNQGSTATFEILDASTADKITGGAGANLDGVVAITLLDGFEPAAGASFDLIDTASPIVLGPNFSFTLPVLTGGKSWNTSAFASSGVISVTSGVALTPFQTWAAGYSLTGNDALSSGNPDKDAFTNLQEFAFGMNPTVAEGALVKIEKSGTNALVTYIERNTDVVYTVKSGTTLTGWTTATGITYLTGVDQTGVPSGYTRKQFTSPLATKDFFRVEAVVNP